ncbi:TPA: polyribonucleotide nucleotidyltransferase [Candidatus Galligastranaerophilus intestinavium]|uniref:Polyribonucleotide nucleotidyltransferase n=1 Tax=Candidatus Galligastranaerophilus intestinavium TaxID=2840836 RepID=A0A9D1FJG7_9BACT|nr:polyribonucleotide nucleotidyltransferase [Candidatus Galligastranaerophilus intestinavium]
MEVTIGDKLVTIETGKYAKQATSSVTVRCEDTMLFIHAIVSKEPRVGIDFFPLLIDYEERMSAIGRIPGGYTRTEGRSSEKAILVSRLIDRPIRPLWPKGYRNDVQIVSQLFSYDQKNQPDVLSILGASAALMLTGAPFEGPVGAIRVGRIDGQMIANPTHQECEKSDMDIVIAGTHDSVIMVEAGCKFVTEDDIMAAVEFAQVEIRKQCDAQLEFARACGVEKENFVNPYDTSELAQIIKDNTYDMIVDAYHNFDREYRQNKLEEAKNIVKEKIEALDDEHPIKKMMEETGIDFVAEEFKALEKKIMRAMIKDEGVRADGRKITDVRPIWCEVGVIPRAHGSAVFTRGQTQILSCATLAGPNMAQELDGVDPLLKKSYMHKYIFPGFSVGEVKPLRGPGRREVGHGNLAERANVPALPDEKEFPYAIRVTSDVLESNGSTSMGSTCASSMALMDAGVPVKCMISGVAMGLIKEGDTDIVLTDIQGIEDFLGDMDFKVTGNSEGITALQMDMKIKGISNETLRRALYQAKDGRLHIMECMKEAISAPRADLSPFAPRLYTLTIPQDDIGTVIGPGGKMIRSIIDASGAEIDIQDDGTVTVTSNDKEGADIAIKMIKDLTFKPEVGMVVKGKVVRIIPIGAFVELAPGKDGMVHISQVCNERIETIEPHLSIGQEVIVKVIKIDDKGRVNLTIKGVSEDEKANCQ